jgi:signal transduction histidine kinase/DNA-binding response OmpR family regulator/ligand-binding sensor domain-containing protein
MRILFNLILLFSFVLPAYPIYFKHIGVKEGLSQISVMSIYQDELDRMWFGTLVGVSMFNGERTIHYKPYKNRDQTVSAIHNDNRAIVGDRRGSIYFQSGFSLVKYDIKEEHFSSLDAGKVYGLYFNEDQLFIGGKDSVSLWNESKQEKELLFALGCDGCNVQKLYKAKNGIYWIGTNKGLYAKAPQSPPRLVVPKDDVTEIMPDSRGNIWVGTRMNGLLKIDRYEQITKFEADITNPHAISSNQIRQIVEDDEGYLWIGTFTGLNKLDLSTNKFTHYTKDTLPGSLTHASVFSVYKDKQGSIWTGTYYGGVNYFNPELDLFAYYPENEGRDDCVSNSYVGHMVEDKRGDIWICTEGGGLNRLNRKTKKMDHFLTNLTSNSIAHNNLKSIAYSAKYDKLYIGTHTGGLSILDIQSGQFKNLYTDDPTYASLAGDVVIQTEIYNEDSLVLMTRTGLFYLDLKTERLSPVFDKQGARYTGVNFVIDSNDYIWIVREFAVVRTNLYNPKDEKKYKYGSHGLANINVVSVFEDHRKRIYFTTLGAGIYRYDTSTDSFINYTKEDNLLMSNFCYNIRQSIQGYLIISTDQGITFLDTDSRIARSIDLEIALPISGIDIGCGLFVCSNGEIFAGGIDGLTSFYEEEVFTRKKPYNLYFSNLYVGGEVVKPKDDHNILSQSLAFTSSIKLNYDQNNFSIGFASTNYVNTLTKQTFEYNLKGFNEKWLPLNQKQITYTNLNPGAYTLRVREQSISPLLPNEAIQLGIEIISPWYANRIAYTVYLLLLIAAVYFYINAKKVRFVLQSSLALERSEKKRIAELNKTKIQFFSNISHEFRTPLTLIISQLELLLHQHSLAPMVYNKVLKAYKNTTHLQDLITELLDFRKLEAGGVVLKVSNGDIVSFLRDLHATFQEYATSHNITYLFTANQPSIDAWFDIKQMRKVFNNLISNAFKFISKEGKIEIVIEETANAILIKVIDDGIGIEKQDIKHIFDCFYQASEASISNVHSTGIGLSLSKNIIELHHGSIHVESTPGYGSIFIISLQKGKAHFIETNVRMEEISQEDMKQSNLQPQPVAINDPAMELTPSTDQQKPKLLVVEDNEEILKVLYDLFTPTYHVLLAYNGKVGFEVALAEQPDIIVSDVMMPEVSGTELCTKIKNNFDTSHIPILLLTALSSDDQSIIGFQCGADDYVAKPFKAKVLLARCNALVRNRIILQKRFNKQDDFDPQLLATSPLDQHFLDTVNQIIESNLNNADFDMNQLAKELALSRSSLYAKFKNLTGTTPNEFVQTCKLKRATLLLRNNPELQITDIAEMLGFGSSRYFTRCFKAQYQMTPIEYRRKL